MKSQAVFAIIGAGGISRSQHLANLTRAPHVRLKTVCDRDAERAEQARRDYDVPCAATDHEEVLADPEIDAVVVATREDVHVPLAVAALEAGKHVYVEKPLAATAEECCRVVEAERAAGRIAVVGHNRRMAPACVQARQIIARHGAHNIHYRISDTYSWLWGRDYPPGVRVIHEGCHVFDLLRYLTGAEVTSVYCVASRPDDESMVLTFDSGCVASVMSTGYVRHDMPKESMETILDLGAVTMTDFVELRTFGLEDFRPVYRYAGHVHPLRDDAHRDLYEAHGAEALMLMRRLFHERHVRKERLREEAADYPTAARALKVLDAYDTAYRMNVSYSVDKGWLAAMDHFAECILTGAPVQLARPEDGLAVARITEAVIESRDSGRIVTL